MKDMNQDIITPYGDSVFHVFGINGLDMHTLFDKCHPYYDFEQFEGDIVIKVYDTEDESEHYQMYWKGASTQGVEVTFFPGDKPHLHIKLPWLGCVGDVELAYALLRALKEMYPQCEIYFNDDIDKGTFVVNEDNHQALMGMRLKNMQHVVSTSDKGGHVVAQGVLRDFVIPTIWDYPGMSVEDLAVKAMNMFNDLQWQYQDVENASLWRVGGKDNDDAANAVPIRFLDNSKDVFVGICSRVIMYVDEHRFKDVPISRFIKKLAGSPFITMVDPMQFVLKQVPNDVWVKLYNSFEGGELSYNKLHAKTYLLRWNPNISSFTLQRYKEATNRYPDGFGMNWSVYEWEQAKEGDHYFMLRTGDDKAGIVFRGQFLSDPYKGEDWAGKGKQRYYVDINCLDATKPDEAPYISVEELESAIPSIDWRKGHSGELLSDNATSILNKLFEEKLK